MSDQIVDDLYKSIGDLKLVTKMVSSFREYNQMKGRYENN
jgi:hypothetical protein